MAEAENSNTIGYSAKQFSAKADHCPKADSHMLDEGLILGVENLMKNIGDMKAEYEKMTNHILIARNLADGTDNVDNLRLIINDLSGWLGHIIEKDSALFNNICEMLKSLREVFILYEKIEKKEK